MLFNYGFICVECTQIEFHRQTIANKKAADESRFIFVIII